jgi:hypothetical protein
LMRQATQQMSPRVCLQPSSICCHHDVKLDWP